MKLRKNSMQIKLMMFFTILATVLFISVGFLFFRSTKDAIDFSKEKEFITLAEETSNKIERYMLERYEDIQVMVTSPLLKKGQMKKDVKLQYLNSVRNAYKAYDYIFITDAVGNIELFSGKPENDYGYKKFLPRVLQGENFVSDFIYFPDTKSYGVYYASPIIDVSNKVSGAVVERMNFNAISDIVKNVHLGVKGYAYIADKQGSSIFNPSNDMENARTFTTENNETSFTIHNHIKYFSAYYPISKYKTQKNTWNIVVEEPVNEAFKITYSLRNYTIVIVIFSVLIVFILVSLLSIKITKPIKTLVKQTQNIAEGYIGKNIKIESGDEIGSLAESFNIVLDNLKAMMQQIIQISGEAASLAEIRQYTGEFFKNIPSALITIDNMAKITTFNHEASNITGINEKDVLNKSVTDPFDIMLLPIIRLLLQGLEKDIIYIKHIIKIKGNMGIETPIMINTSLQKDVNGKILGVIGVFRSVEEIKQLEESAIRAKNLESLGAMSAGMAHELRNPLTSIKGYAQYIKSELGESSVLNEDISIVIDEVDRLNTIIDRFLDFARPKELNLELCNINEVLKLVVKLISKEMLPENIGIIMNITNVPLIPFDFEQIEQVILNISMNAIQAMPDGGILTIHSVFLEASNIIEITLQDTGFGISDGNHDKIFEPFFTTKTKGTGLGLAICSRIVENHKGVIEVLSTPEVGTKFTIKLPGPQI
ncbi:HAMP domain-containing protein [Clostridium estertheticum]|uniref:ATP-binding protein n=1 Tax=Clostridium estertheticum TaxID=238834 RepID=UPI0013E90E88|nr:ATP-binding protein [Clostridium estertheticum]MBZ9687707.1 HAMP domain-containing protein [Clostridium estertheticum]